MLGFYLIREWEMIFDTFSIYVKNVRFAEKSGGLRLNEFSHFRRENGPLRRGAVDGSKLHIYNKRQPDSA